MGEIKTDVNTDNKIQKLLETNYNATIGIDNIPIRNNDILQAKIDNSINISQSTSENSSTSTVDVSNIDFSRISSNANDAISGNFIKEENIHKEYWQGELTFIKRDDGSIQILKDGVVMGYTDAKGLNSESSSKIDEVHTSRLDSYDQRDTVNTSSENSNLTDRGYPSSTEGTSTNSSSESSNLTDRGYSSSTEGTSTPSSNFSNKSSNYTIKTENANTLLRNRLDIPFEDLGRGTTNSNVTSPFSKFAYNNQTGNYDLLRTDGSVYASYTIDVMQEICGKSVNGAVLGPSTK